MELSKMALDRDFNAVKAQELDLSILLDLSDLAMGFWGVSKLPGANTRKIQHEAPHLSKFHSVPSCPIISQ